MKKRIVVNLIITVLAVLFVFVDCTNLNPLYPEGAFFWCVMITIYIAVNTLLSKFGKIFAFNNGNDFEGNTIFKGFDSFKKFPKLPIIIIASVWIIYIGVNIGSSVLFHQKAYKDQIGEWETRTFSSDMQAIDISKTPIVDKELAKKLADKKMGEKPSLGSQAYLGEPTIQMVNDNLVWVVPLHHSGFFKWLTKMDGADGYIVVSATNTNDVKYMENYKIKYQPDSYFFDDILRHARVGINGALFKGITDYSFEIDDSGNPYWVITTYKYLRGFALPEADGVIIMDAQNGKMEKYSLDNIPSWVDRVQPEDFIMNQINNRGNLVHGIFNFSNLDKFQTSQGEIIVYNNGECYLFTGITSVGSDESAIGFVMVDMITKKPYFYEMPGATEYAAQQSAEGKVQNLKYYASFPLIINVNGEPTYFMTLKDKEGLIKQYAYVSVTDYSIVGTGQTMNEAMADYSKNIKHSTGSNTGSEVSGELENVKGTVGRIASYQAEGNTVYNMIISQMPDKVFTVPYSIADTISLTKEGDTVVLEYSKTDSSLINAISFKNITLGDVTEE